MTSRELRLSALAISTICCWASESRDTGVAGEKFAPEPVEIGLHGRVQLVASTSCRKPYFLGSRPI